MKFLPVDEQDIINEGRGNEKRNSVTLRELVERGLGARYVHRIYSSGATWEHGDDVVVNTIKRASMRINGRPTRCFRV